MLGCLHEERFQDRAPAAVYATLLDEGHYRCSIRTIYRLLAKNGETRERRDQLTHPPYQKPELLATAPNQLWSWDIAELLGPVKWTYFYLYVILDVFSRFVVGWMVAPRESAELAKRLIADSCDKQNIAPGQLTIHADRGSSMTSKPVAFLMADLGVAKPHSQPYVSDDDPYSESQVRTMKYRPSYPTGSVPSRRSRAFCQQFFAWYNEEHRHPGLELLTPAIVRYGEARAVVEQRQAVLDAAYQPTRNGSSGSHRDQRQSHRRCGSTSRQKTKVSKFNDRECLELIDTRRSSMRSRPIFRAALRCIWSWTTTAPHKVAKVRGWLRRTPAVPRSFHADQWQLAEPGGAAVWGGDGTMRPSRQSHCCSRA